MSSHPEAVPGQRVFHARSENPIGNKTDRLDADSKAREERIAIIAYYKAQQRGFADNRELDDWLAAEREVDAADRAVTEGRDHSETS
jgi:hypothetical protein